MSRLETPRARRGTGARRTWTFRPTPAVEDAVHAWALRHGHDPDQPGARTSALVDLITTGHAAQTRQPCPGGTHTLVAELDACVDCGTSLDPPD